MRIEHYFKQIPDRHIAVANDYLETGAFERLQPEVTDSLRAAVGKPRPKTAALYFHEGSAVEVRKGSCTCGKHKEKKPCAHIAALIMDVTREMMAGPREDWFDETEGDFREVDALLDAETLAEVHRLWPSPKLLDEALRIDGRDEWYLFFEGLLEEEEFEATFMELLPATLALPEYVQVNDLSTATSIDNRIPSVLAKALGDLPAAVTGPALLALCEEIPDLTIGNVLVPQFIAQVALPSLGAGLSVPLTVDQLHGLGMALGISTEDLASVGNSGEKVAVEKFVKRLGEVSTKVAAFAKTRVTSAPAEAFELSYVVAISGLETVDVGVAGQAALREANAAGLAGMRETWPRLRRKEQTAWRGRMKHLMNNLRDRETLRLPWVVDGAEVERVVRSILG